MAYTLTDAQISILRTEIPSNSIQHYVDTVWDAAEATAENSGNAAVEAKISGIASTATWEKVRVERDRLLAETDFFALSDVTMSSEMSAYRQSLRDIPANNSDPSAVSWPVKP